VALLELDELDAHYGRIRALDGVSLRVEEGEIVTLIGANGAGKTTTLRTISGLTRATRGRIRFGGSTSRVCRPTASCAPESGTRPKDAASSRG